VERRLDAAAKLSEVRMIAGELVRTRKALNQAKAKLAVAARHPQTCITSTERAPQREHRSRARRLVNESCAP
jgi:hypothetical protein